MLARKKWQIRTIAVLDRVFEERVAQVDEYGFNRDLDYGTGPETRWLPDSGDSAEALERRFRQDYIDFEEETGKPTWVHLIREEVAEAFMESDPARLKHELLQVAALCVSFVETIEEHEETASKDETPAGTPAD